MQIIRVHLQICEQPNPGLNKNIFNIPVIKHAFHLQQLSCEHQQHKC